MEKVGQTIRGPPSLQGRNRDEEVIIVQTWGGVDVVPYHPALRAANLKRSVHSPEKPTSKENDCYQSGRNMRKITGLTRGPVACKLGYQE